MAYYAFLDENNIVVDVISGKNEDEDGINWEIWYGQFRGLKCKRTSYNTIGGIHELGKEPFRKNYAGIGFFYDSQRDAFIPPQPFPSWTLDEDTCLWNPPIPEPRDGFVYLWSEQELGWIKQNDDVES